MTTFAVFGGSPHLAIARLVEARRGHPLRIRARWKPEGASSAVEMVGAVPDAWRPMMCELGIGGGVVN